MKDRNLDRIAGRRGAVPIPLYSLMSRRVRNILLVSSLYDSYTLEEDGRFTEVLFSEYLTLNLRYAPHVHRVSTASEALAAIQSEHFDLVITMVRVGSMRLEMFTGKIKEIDPELPVVVLAYTSRDLEVLRKEGKLESVDRTFIWQGDVRLFLAVVKWVEDRLNMEHDCAAAGVKCIIIVEDSIRFYSSYMPLLYTELMEQTQALMTDAVNQMQMLMRMRARPKILHAQTYEEALALYLKYSEHTLGIILDVRFEKAGIEDPLAGFALAREIRLNDPECPILFQSSEGENRDRAYGMNTAYINKNSPTLLAEVRQFMREYLGFGDFVVKDVSGNEVARAEDLKGLSRVLRVISDESLIRHAVRNDFSTWLMARTEFDLARALKPQKVEDFNSPEELRQYLLSSIKLYRDRYRAGQVEEFSGDSFDVDTEFVKIGSGSLGGKGRGLAFMNALLSTYLIDEHFPGVSISVPPTAVIATDIFDAFMEAGDLRDLVIFGNDRMTAGQKDSAITEAFLASELPGGVVEDLRIFLEKVDCPLAVRSSSLLEDSPAQPFAGIYSTYMLPNNNPDLNVRLDELCDAVKLVYASTYYSDSVSYMESTPNRLEEEKMAVVVQEVVGKKYGDSVYPNFAGVARSFNYYPLDGMAEGDGVASVALGFGGTVMNGGKSVRFSPASPRRLYQFSSVDQFLQNSQREFLALDLSGGAGRPDGRPSEDMNMILHDLERAQEDGTLLPVGSVHSPENDMIIDGTFRDGAKLVTMAGVLKGDEFPLAPVLSFLLEVGKAAFACEIEIEFAVNLGNIKRDEKSEFGFLQIRPMGFSTEMAPIMDDIDEADVICKSSSVLGVGRIDGIRDIIYIPGQGYDRSTTAQTALEIESVNKLLRSEDRSCLLIGPGRWGSSDRWLGIPVKWSQISSVRCIVETPLEDLYVAPSQGTHFFQNITSLGIGYFTLSRSGSDNFLDTDWLDAAHLEGESEHVRHIRLEEPLEILIDRTASKGIIMHQEKSNE